MALHKDLTGSDLHEPKGIEVAPEATVYVADGIGSGEWVSQYAGLLVSNQYWMTAYMADISTAANRAFFYVPVQSEIFELSAITTAILTTGNAILSIYINGVLFPETLTVFYSGSGVGTTTLEQIATVNTIPAGSTIEVRSDGGSDTTCPTYLAIGLRAK